MQLKPKASLAFKKTKPSAKPSFGTNVINSLDTIVTAANARFAVADLPVPVATLLTINNDLAAAISDALTGNHTAVASVKDAVTAWNEAFTLTANFISTNADGSIPAIREAGFVPTKSETTPAQKPGAAANFKATINGSKGAIMAGSKTAVAGATAYLYTAAPDGVAISYNGNTVVITVGEKSVYIVADTKKQIEICNLPNGLPLNVSMVAVNAAGTGPATAPQQVITQ